MVVAISILMGCTASSLPKPSSIEAFCERGPARVNNLMHIVEATMDGDLKAVPIEETRLKSYLRTHGGVIMRWSPAMTLPLPSIARWFPDHRLPVQAVAIPAAYESNTKNSMLIYLYREAIHYSKRGPVHPWFWYPFYSQRNIAVCI